VSEPRDLPSIDSHSGDGLDGRHRSGSKPAAGDARSAATHRERLQRPPTPWPDEGIESHSRRTHTSFPATAPSPSTHATSACGSSVFRRAPQRTPRGRSRSCGEPVVRCPTAIARRPTSTSRGSTCASSGPCSPPAAATRRRRAWRSARGTVDLAASATPVTREHSWDRGLPRRRSASAARRQTAPESRDRGSGATRPSQQSR